MMEKDTRLMEASFWERLNEGNWVLFWWAGPCLLLGKHSEFTHGGLNTNGRLGDSQGSLTSIFQPFNFTRPVKRNIKRYPVIFGQIK